MRPRPRLIYLPPHNFRSILQARSGIKNHSRTKFDAAFDLNKRPVVSANAEFCKLCHALDNCEYRPITTLTEQCARRDSQRILGLPNDDLHLDAKSMTKGSPLGRRIGETNNCINTLLLDPEC